MTKRFIKPAIIPVSVAVLVISLAIIGDPFKRNGSSLYWISVEFFLIFILPTFPLIYGHITKDNVVSMSLGMSSVLGLFIGLLSKTYKYPFFESWLISAIPFWMLLAIIACLEGYFAAKSKSNYLLLAIALYILFILLFLFGLMD